jgi:hypothetical protein
VPQIESLFGSGRDADRLPDSSDPSGPCPRYFMPVVCTDRGQHEPVLLTTARRHLDGTRGMNYALEYFAPPMSDAYERSGVGRGSYVFRCPRCPRTPTIKADRWWDLLDALVRADGQRMDVSLLARYRCHVVQAVPGRGRGYFHLAVTVYCSLQARLSGGSFKDARRRS